MCHKEKIIEFMKGRVEVSLKEQYAGLPDIKPQVIRAIIYLDIKNKGKMFKKVIVLP
jgi:hypothetical protein